MAEGKNINHGPGEREPVEAQVSTQERIAAVKKSRYNLHALLEDTFESRKIRMVLLVGNHTKEGDTIQKSVQKSQKDFLFVRAKSLAEAEKVIKDNRVDVILQVVDYHEFDIDSLAAFLKAHEELPLVLISDEPNERLAMQTVKLGVQDFILKGQTNGFAISRSLRYAIERKRSELLAKKTIKLEQNVLREIVEHAPILLIRFNGNYKIIDCNKPFTRFVEKSRNELIGAGLLEVIPELNEKSVQDVLFNNKPFRVDQLELSRSHSVFLQVFGWSIGSTYANKNEAILVAIDITKRVIVEQQRDEFYAALAHDIRNPLLGEQQVLNALIERSTASPDHDILISLKTSCQNSLFMLNNMLSVYKLENSVPTLALQKIDIQSMVHDIVQEFHYLLKHKRINADIRFSDDPHAIYADSIAVRRVLANLMHNAAQAAPEDSTIKVGISFGKPDLTIRINNQGPPILQEQLKHLFDRFPPGTSSYKSHGLGLYLCKTLVDQLDGTITCASDETIGTTFTIVMPTNLNRKETT